jgi:hypothetical protein
LEAEDTGGQAGGEQITSTTLHPHASRRKGKGVSAENTPRCLVLVTHWVCTFIRGHKGSWVNRHPVTGRISFSCRILRAGAALPRSSCSRCKPSHPPSSNAVAPRRHSKPVLSALRLNRHATVTSLVYPLENTIALFFNVVQCALSPRPRSPPSHSRCLNSTPKGPPVGPCGSQTAFG